MNSSQLLRNRSEVEFLTPTPMTVLAFSRSLLTSGEKSESPLMMTKVSTWPLRVAQVERIDDHADVGGVLAGLTHVRDLDEFEGRLVQTALEVLVPVEVAVGFFDDDVTLEQQALEHLFDVEARVFGVARTESNVLEVEKHRHGGIGGRVGHAASSQPSAPCRLRPAKTSCS